ncbi:DUF2752 domain-containing protein [Aureibaculum marinum]|uniref:DUF2752 domain-containing protein n=1 Tax=Aureibaculum marinum TaxID=2487930 RepID=A0A3N4NMU6_9FLAO|nr:DUF2752 domain-containing protein [Aureibaculum marinum]RPD94476.1 DUF2752 domain-containing protein [Aureibaculum marinum]
MLLLSGVIALFYFIVFPNEIGFILRCPLYDTTGVYCPGCGSQRAIHNLVHGNFLAALKQNIMLILGVLALLYHYGIVLSNSIFKTNFKSILNNKKVLLIALAILLLFWILRNIPYYPFTFLAPTN